MCSSNKALKVMLTLSHLSVDLAEKNLLTDLSLTIPAGTVHACMGPNGSGKSSLAYTLMGHPRYHLSHGSIIFEEVDITSFSPDKRARAGMFLSLQQPYEIPGVTLSTLLRESFHAVYGQDMVDVYIDRLTQGLRLLKMDGNFLQRAVHEGFSGGEKKRCEMLQLLVLQPKFVILDEVDSGLDVDAFKLVVNALEAFRTLCPQSSILLITHYQTMLTALAPDTVSLLREGKLIAQGGPELGLYIQQYGYEHVSY
jgi:Fe-S cluster assembly ATP-binding protein